MGCALASGPVQDTPAVAAAKARFFAEYNAAAHAAAAAPDHGPYDDSHGFLGDDLHGHGHFDHGLAHNLLDHHGHGLHTLGHLGHGHLAHGLSHNGLGHHGHGLHGVPHAGRGHGFLHLPDTPSVQAAKAHHFALVDEALHQHHHKRRSANGFGALPHHGHYVGPYAHLNGGYGFLSTVPAETPAVQYAKAHHFAAVSEALARTHYHKKRSANGFGAFPHHGHYVGPYAHLNGGYGFLSTVPAETPAVQYAKAHHFAAVSEALARNSYH